MTINPKILIDDLHPGMDNGVESWYAEPHKTVKIGGKVFKGTFRSFKCNSMTSRSKRICSECSSITKLLSFQKRLQLRISKERSVSIRTDFLNKTELLDKSRRQSKQVESLRYNLFLEKSKTARLKIRTRTLKEKLDYFAKSGRIGSITHKLVTAVNDGKLKDKDILLDMLESIAKNLHAKGPQGHRFNSSTQQFYEMLLILGGLRLPQLVSQNLDGPGINTVYHWRKQHSLNLKSTPCQENMEQFVSLYKGLMQKNNIGTKVPVLTAEDETAIKQMVSYSQETDELLGFCALKVDDNGKHACMSSFEIVLGDEE
eukprot:Seg4447.5 transcript_id=Seg4447.5/GoldUCD/mRNA.D3Y31 product="hypothetical protein" protein_id=Seg4447.5/GoldUCD/D3Y31